MSNAGIRDINNGINQSVDLGKLNSTPVIYHNNKKITKLETF